MMHGCENHGETQEMHLKVTANFIRPTTPDSPR
jgi:hypothetical protein